jgi:hypothetical protein
MGVGAAGLGVRVGGRFVAVAAGETGVGVAAAVAVGARVAVGGTGVAVSGTGASVTVGGMGVRVAVGGIGVGVNTGWGAVVGGIGVDVNVGWGAPHAAKSIKSKVKSANCGNNILRSIASLPVRLPLNPTRMLTVVVRNSAVGWDGRAVKAAMGVLREDSGATSCENRPAFLTNGAANEIRQSNYAYHTPILATFTPRIWPFRNNSKAESRTRGNRTHGAGASPRSSSSVTQICQS